MAPAVPETAFAPFAGTEAFHLFQFHLHDRHDHQLGDALAAAHYGDLRSLLAGWRYFHRWVGLLVVGLVLIHVWAGWRYADLGGRG